jgi:murein L,D-transpeptidase YafK
MDTLDFCNSLHLLLLLSSTLYRPAEQQAKELQQNELCALKVTKRKSWLNLYKNRVNKVGKKVSSNGYNTVTFSTC